MCYYRTYNPVAAVTNITNAQFSTRLLAASTLRNILGTKSLQEILQDREIIANQMKVNQLEIKYSNGNFCCNTILKIKALLDEATESWGIRVERTEV